MKNKNPQTILQTKSGNATLTWIKDSNLAKYKPFFQVYGICFNNKGEILLIEEKEKWKIPGGTPERGETAEETLKRELIEEADVRISKCIPLGVQHVCFPKNPNAKEGDNYYQYRYVCFIDELMESSPDPDTGLINERKFVPGNEITKHVKWGDAGNTMFEDACAVFKENID